MEIKKTLKNLWEKIKQNRTVKIEFELIPLISRENFKDKNIREIIILIFDQLKIRNLISKESEKQLSDLILEQRIYYNQIANQT